MPTWQADVDRWLSTHHGVATTGELQSLGVAPRTISRRVARGQLVHEQPGVFRSAQYPPSALATLRAACARNPDALVAFTSACHEWHFRNIPETGVHILVPHGVSPELDGITVHRCRRIDPVDVVERADGVRLTSPPRTLFDSADMLGVSLARSATEQIIRERMCTLATIIDTFARLRHPQRPGSRTMALVLASRPPWRAALQSHLEHTVLEACEAHRLPPVTAQCPVHLANGRVIHLDFGWPEFRVGLEVDDPAWHAGLDERRRDTRRDRKAAVAGWQVTRVTKLDVEGDLGDALSDLALILGQRGWAA